MQKGSGKGQLQVIDDSGGDPREGQNSGPFVKIEMTAARHGVASNR